MKEIPWTDNESGIRLSLLGFSGKKHISLLLSGPWVLYRADFNFVRFYWWYELAGLFYSVNLSIDCLTVLDYKPLTLPVYGLYLVIIAPYSDGLPPWASIISLVRLITNYLSISLFGTPALKVYKIYEKFR